MNATRRRASATRVLFAALFIALGAVFIAAVPPRLSPRDLATGRMLIATPQITGPFFSQSVVLLLAYDATQGAAGLIVNRRSRLTLEEVVPDVGDSKLAKSAVHFGGPVSPETVSVAWRGAETPDGAQRVLDDLHASTRATVLEHLIRTDMPADEVRAFVGYAGWSAGQLESEIARGDWIVMRGDAELVFLAEPEKLWPKLIGVHEGLQASRPAETRAL